jgi:hypothetical protein
MPDDGHPEQSGSQGDVFGKWHCRIDVSKNDSVVANNCLNLPDHAKAEQTLPFDQMNNKTLGRQIINQGAWLAKNKDRLEAVL